MINVELAQFDGGKNNAEMVVGVAMSVRDGLKQSEANVRGTDKCPYYYLKLEESLRELDPDTDPNHAILVEKSKNIFLKTMESRYKMRIINLTGFLKKRGIIK